MYYSIEHPDEKLVIFVFAMLPIFLPIFLISSGWRWMTGKSKKLPGSLRGLFVPLFSLNIFDRSLETFLQNLSIPLIRTKCSLLPNPFLAYSRVPQKPLYDPSSFIEVRHKIAVIVVQKNEQTKRVDVNDPCFRASIVLLHC